MRLTSVSMAKAECVHCGLRSRFTDLSLSKETSLCSSGDPRQAALNGCDLPGGLEAELRLSVQVALPPLAVTKINSWASVGKPLRQPGHESPNCES